MPNLLFSIVRNQASSELALDLLVNRECYPKLGS